MLITTASDHQLALSPKHYVIVAPDQQLVQARRVRLGQLVHLADGTTSPVVAKTVERRTGLFNPHTLDGTIVVDGVLASCYTGSVEPATAHALLWPLRILRILGMSIETLPAISDYLRNSALALLPKGQ